jgi:hypothetical protein
MNARQRRKNRATARDLENSLRVGRRHTSLCPECGEEGPHFVAPSLGMPGFWTCAKFYGPDGRRLAEFVDEIVDPIAAISFLLKDKS